MDAASERELRRKEAYLRRFHDADPGRSGRGLLAGRTRQGHTTYDLVAECARCESVLDVGCGDGVLLAQVDATHAVGVDFSRAELRAAKRRLPSAHWVEARSDALPFKGETFDVVVIHASLIAMPVEETLKEVYRVLRRGGRLVTLEQSDLPPQGAFREFVLRLSDALPENTPTLGDARVTDREAMDRLLGSLGFEGVRFRDTLLEFGAEERKVFFASLYGFDLLDPAAQAHALAAPGTTCVAGVRLTEATKAAASE
ncbi:MAG: class I SAM-dependent methyltransferase [Myxococcota bacterium]